MKYNLKLLCELDINFANTGNYSDHKETIALLLFGVGNLVNLFRNIVSIGEFEHFKVVIITNLEQKQKSA